MAVYVDNERIKWRGALWCHLVADSLEELHAFATCIGLRRAWFQDRASYPHYDVTTDVRERALLAGALASRKRDVLMAARKLKSELDARAPRPQLADVNREPSSLTLSLF
jgi:hypothetical protein